MFLFFLKERDDKKVFFFFSSRRRHTRWPRDWSSDVCSSDLWNAQSPKTQPSSGYVNLPTNFTGDRKSTRLNSSHVANAYAVFCLKKKKKRSEILRLPILVGDVLDEQHEQDIVLVLVCVHAAAHFIAFFFFNDTATTEIYTLSLHDALPICIAHSLPLSAVRALPRSVVTWPPPAGATPGTQRPPGVASAGRGQPRAAATVAGQPPSRIGMSR